MQTTKSQQAGERTHKVTMTAAEFSEEQFAKRRKADIEKALHIIAWELETEEDIRNALSERLAQNQKLKTSEERHNDGFSIIYGDFSRSEYRVEKLREAAAALRAIA